MVWDYHDFIRVPNLCIFAEFSLEHPDGSGSTDVVSHQCIHVHPYVLAGDYLTFTRCPGQYFFSKRHCSKANLPAYLRSRKEALEISRHLDMNAGDNIAAFELGRVRLERHRFVVVEVFAADGEKVVLSLGTADVVQKTSLRVDA